MKYRVNDQIEISNVGGFFRVDLLQYDAAAVMTECETREMLCWLADQAEILTRQQARRFLLWLTSTKYTHGLALVSESDAGIFGRELKKALKPTFHKRGSLRQKIEAVTGHTSMYLSHISSGHALPTIKDAVAIGAVVGWTADYSLSLRRRDLLARAMGK